MPTEMYKGYWMITNRCNLRCSYCVLENAQHQLARELPLEEKLALVDHLYGPLGFRRLTLSGGEATLIGAAPPRDFVRMVEHLGNYRSRDPEERLEVELYTNGRYLDRHVIGTMAPVIDTVAVTIDSAREATLVKIGRQSSRIRQSAGSHAGGEGYLDRMVDTCAALTAEGIELKLHTVVSQQNVRTIGAEVPEILERLARGGARVAAWKFYQYMSYDDPERDVAHRVAEEVFADIESTIRGHLQGLRLALHFKGNTEMDASLFNILAYGNAQYMRSGDTWTTSRRTRDLRTYPSMRDLFAEHDIDVERFRRFHQVHR